MSKALRSYCFLYASCSMLYYLLLTKLLAEFTGDVMLWTSVASGVFLGATGLGVYWSERAFKHNVFRLVVWIETALAVWGAGSVVALYLWHMLYRIYMYEFGYHIDTQSFRPLLLFGAVAQILVAGVGVLSGLEFGLVNQMGYRSGLARVQKLLVVYQFGGLLGTLALLLAMAPRLEPLAIGFIVAAVNLLAVLAWAHTFRREVAWRWAWRAPLACAVGLAGLALLCQTYDLPQLQRKNFYYNDLGWAMNSEGLVSHYRPYGLLEWQQHASEYPNVERHRGLYQNIDLLSDHKSRMAVVDLASPDGWSLFMDGHFQVSSQYEDDYHQAMAHVPATLLGRCGPKAKVLIIGGGDGLMVREMLRYGDEVEHVSLIDIDPQILGLAGEHPRLLQLNHAAILDPKVAVVATDAFQALRHSHEVYDKIYVDVLFPYNFETSRLYSLEFFASLRRHLAPGGHLSILSPVEVEELGDPEDQKVLAVMTSTLHAAGFQDLYLYGEKRHAFLLALGEPLAAGRLEQAGRSPYWRFIDHPDHMEKVTALTEAPRRELVNSILRPTFFGQPDTNF